MHFPTHLHHAVVKHLLQYVKHTGPDEELNLDLFADSDWAEDRNNRKSTSGYIVMLHETVAKSSVEAEYVHIGAINLTKNP